MTERIRFHERRFAGIDAMSAATGRSFPRHTHDQYGIGIVDSGGHASWSGRGHVEAGPGKFICVNPGEVHDGRAIGGGTRSWRILYFEPEGLNQMRWDILEGAQSSYVFRAPVFDDRILLEVFNCAFAHATAQGSGDMACETAMLHLVARLERHSSSGTTRTEAPRACIRRARERIDSDPAAPLTLAELAKEAGLSRYQLLRSFARAFGLTPHAYILQRRLAWSRRLIRAGVPLTEAAMTAGFCDQSHLHRCFVRQFGVTPRSYALGG